MKSWDYKTLIACYFSWYLKPAVVAGQDLTGIWRGYFITETGDNYRLEFQIQENKNKTVTGVSYSYLDTRFYGKAAMTGKVGTENGFTIQETKTIEVKNMSGGGTCIMNYLFTYAKSAKEEFLEGTYLGRTEDRVHPENNGKWGDCGGGKVYLRRVQNSDFYVEPFLRNNTPKDPDTIASKPAPPKVIKSSKKPVAKAPQKTPGKKQLAVKKPVVATKKPAPEKKPTVAKTKPDVDTPQRKAVTPVITDKPVERPKITIPTTTRSRDNNLVQTLTVNNEDVVVRLYDNGEIDGDTISVYLDGKPILVNKGLSSVPITVKLKMDDDNAEHTLVMVAENMGRIPPNTSLMIVQDGDKRYQVNITSTLQKNAMVRFRYKPKGGE